MSYFTLRLWLSWDSERLFVFTYEYFELGGTSLLALGGILTEVLTYVPSVVFTLRLIWFMLPGIDWALTCSGGSSSDWTLVVLMGLWFWVWNWLWLASSLSKDGNRCGLMCRSSISLTICLCDSGSGSLSPSELSRCCFRAIELTLGLRLVSEAVMCYWSSW